MVEKKHPFTGYPAAKHQKHSKFAIELFLSFNTGIDSSLRNNFANSGFFAKVSVPVHIIIPCIYPQNSWSCTPTHCLNIQLHVAMAT